MNNTKVTLAPLKADDREQFILDNQESFKYGAVEEFGLRDDHFEEDGEIISRATIEQSIDAPDSEAYRILYDGRKVGGVVLKSTKRHITTSWNFFSFRQRNTAKASAMALGLPWKLCTPKPRSGRPARHILKSAISIFISTNAVSTPSSFSPPCTRSRIRRRKTEKQRPMRGRMKCSALKRLWNETRNTLFLPKKSSLKNRKKYQKC